MRWLVVNSGLTDWLLSGGLENEELLARKIVEKLGAVVVNVDYRLGPEWKVRSEPTSSA